MGDKKRVIVCWSNRSERGLLDPVIKRLRKYFEVTEFRMGKGEDPFKMGGLFESTHAFFNECQPDLVITPFDRKEQIFVALAARMLNLKVAQLHAGDISQEGCWDDQVRHMISLCCDYLFCNGEESAERARKLVRLTGSSAKVFEVGSTAFDDLEINTSACPRGGVSFDVVVYSPPTRRPDLIEKELDEIESLLDKPTVWIGPSGDLGSDLITSRAKELERMSKLGVGEWGEGKVKFRPNLPRPKLLGLLKECTRAIGNSSAFFCELPFFGKSHIHIGVRNKGREIVKVKTGGSDRIVEILRKELETA